MYDLELELAVAHFRRLCTNSATWDKWYRAKGGWLGEDLASVDACGSGVVVLKTKDHRRIVAVTSWCKSWSCPKCGPAKAEMWFRKLYCCIRNSEQVWATMIHLSGKKERRKFHDRLRQRASKKQANFAVICREGGVTYVLATRKLGGTEQPKKMAQHRVSVALKMLYYALRTPGITPYGVSSSRPWRPSKPVSNYELLIKAASPQEFCAAAQAIGMKANGLPPDGMSIDEAGKRLVEEILRIRHSRK